MPDDRQELRARAQWCRRLASCCTDNAMKASLEDLAGDYQRRAEAAADAGSTKPNEDSTGGNSRQ